MVVTPVCCAPLVFCATPSQGFAQRTGRLLGGGSADPGKIKQQSIPCCNKEDGAQIKQLGWEVDRISCTSLFPPDYYTAGVWPWSCLCRGHWSGEGASFRSSGLSWTLTSLILRLAQCCRCWVSRGLFMSSSWWVGKRPAGIFTSGMICWSCRHARGVGKAGTCWVTHVSLSSRKGIVVSKAASPGNCMRTVLHEEINDVSACTGTVVPWPCTRTVTGPDEKIVFSSLDPVKADYEEPSSREALIIHSLGNPIDSLNIPVKSITRLGGDCFFLANSTADYQNWLTSLDCESGGSSLISAWISQPYRLHGAAIQGVLWNHLLKKLLHALLQVKHWTLGDIFAVPYMGSVFLSIVEDEVWRQQVGQSLANSPPSWQMKQSSQVRSGGEKGIAGTPQLDSRHMHLKGKQSLNTQCRKVAQG